VAFDFLNARRSTGRMGEFIYSLEIACQENYERRNVAWGRNGEGFQQEEKRGATYRAPTQDNFSGGP
jgi:hypothetical protein